VSSGAFITHSFSVLSLSSCKFIFLSRINDAKARESVIVDFAATRESKIGELAAKFDLVMGHTPADLGH
jgi:hypothetical protein